MKKQNNNLIGKLVFRLVKKHIAGSTISAVLNTVRELNNKGMHTTVTLLNEHVDDQTKARYNTNAYVQLIKQLSRLHLNCDVSIRPNQIGNATDHALFERNMLEIIDAANSCKHRLWIEDEEGMGMERIMPLYRKFKPKCSSLGVEVRPVYGNKETRSLISKWVSGKDIIKLRYHAEKSKEKGDRVNRFEVYKTYIDALMSRKAHLTVLEHDQGLISRLVSSNKDYKRNLIFEIPLGYNSKLQKLTKNRLNVSIYVPYGKDWIPYFINRLAEGRVRNIAVALLDREKITVGSNAKKGK